MHWLGVYPRPALASTLTLIYHAVPTKFRRDQYDGVPDIAPSWHTSIGKIAAALLLMKEGVQEQGKAVSMLQDTFGEEQISRFVRIAA